MWIMACWSCCRVRGVISGGGGDANPEEAGDARLKLFNCSNRAAHTLWPCPANFIDHTHRHTCPATFTNHTSSHMSSNFTNHTLSHMSSNFYWPHIVTHVQQLSLTTHRHTCPATFINHTSSHMSSNFYWPHIITHVQQLLLTTHCETCSTTYTVHTLCDTHSTTFF